MKDFFRSSNKLRAVLWVLGGFILLLTAFGLGVSVGSRSTAFRVRFGENYFHNFYGEPAAYQLGGPMPNVQGPPNSHGVIGRVVDRATSTLSVVDADGEEVSVAVPTSTPIEEDGNTVLIGAIHAGDTVAVIGAPNGEGQIAARFIRVFSGSAASSTAPLPSSSGSY